jgi:hypothetical protein
VVHCHVPSILGMEGCVHSAWRVVSSHYMRCCVQNFIVMCVQINIWGAEAPYPKKIQNAELRGLFELIEDHRPASLANFRDG